VQGDWFCAACVTAGRDKRSTPLSSPPPPPPPPPLPARARARGVAAAKGKGGGGGVSTAPKPKVGRVHMAAPAARASGARRERNSNKHKRLFLPDEPGGLRVRAPPVPDRAHSAEAACPSRARPEHAHACKPRSG